MLEELGYPAAYPDRDLALLVRVPYKAAEGSAAALRRTVQRLAPADRKREEVLYVALNSVA